MAQDDLIGGRIGKYRVVRLLGRGGMGEVYEGVHVALPDQRAAIKVPRTRDPHLLARLERELRSLADLQILGVVRMLDFERLADDRLAILMEFVTGESLAKRIADRGRLGSGEALQITYKIATVLQEIQRKGYVHRDLSPDNIMLMPDKQVPSGERVVILDLGIARHLRGEEARLTGRAVVGKVEYMPPDEGEPDEKYDVYSLGIILYELIAGEVPFPLARLDNDPIRVLGAKMHRSVPPLDLGEDPLATDLQSLVDGMLAKTPGARWSLDQVLQALERLVPPPPPPGPPSRSAGPSVPSSLASLTEPVARPIDPTAQPHAVPARPWPRWPTVLAAAAIALLLAYLARIFIQGARPEVLIAGGEFEMGSTQEQVEWLNIQCAELPFRNQEDRKQVCSQDRFTRELRQRKVRVSPFWLDATEVTNAQFAAWLDRLPDVRTADEKVTPMEGNPVTRTQILQGGELLAVFTQESTYSGVIRKDGHFVARQGFAQRPVTLVTWHGARRYCEAQRKRLPTEAEWEFAARNGSAGHRYPWGDDAPSCREVVFARRLPGPEGCLSLGPQPAPVGQASRDRTRDGRIFDLAGNVSEWVLDAYVAPYPDCRGPCVDPVVQPPMGQPAERVVRGGAWAQDYPIFCRSAGRSKEPESTVLADLGFRCAAPAATAERADR